jgi:ribosomal protein S18 acetylase RimI-like enzyme
MAMETAFTYTIRDGFDEMDFDRVTIMLKGAFWSPGISRSEVMEGAKNSALVVGVFTGDNVQIGYSRVISDKTRFGYILDVMVDEACRRQGIGQAMVKHILGHPVLKDVYQWLLVTKDAHGVYEKAGFRPIARAGDLMEIRHPRPERQETSRGHQPDKREEGN